MMQTPFERTGLLTSWDDENDFLTAIQAAAPDRVTITTVGTTVEGRPVRMVRIATPDTPADATGPLITAYVHSNEPASREWAMAMIRDLALTTTWVDYIDRHPVHVIPTVSADGIEQPSRSNAAGVNINRDHIGLTQPETRAIWRAVLDTSPDFVVDMHEVHAYWNDVSPLTARSPAVAPATRAESQLLYEAGESAAVAVGLTYGPYLLPVQSTATTHAIPIAYGIPGITPETSAIGPALPERIEAHRIVTWGLLSHHRVRATTIRDMGAASRRWATQRPQDGWFAWGEHQDEAGGTELPDHYRLTSTQWDLIAPQREYHGITGEPDGDHWVVPLLQPARAMVALVLDPDSPYSVVAGERVGLLANPLSSTQVVTAWGPYQDNGRDYPVTLVSVQLDGAMYPIWP